jgi:acyl carrier protein
MTVNGKVDRQALLLMKKEGARDQTEYTPAHTAIEKAIMQIWQEVLETDQFDIHDNFFDIGGHSLLLMRVRTQLQALLAQNIAIVDLLTYPTVASLARYIATRNTDPNRGETPSSRAEKRRKGIERYRMPKLDGNE